MRGRFAGETVDSRRSSWCTSRGGCPSGTFRPRTSAPTCWGKRADALEPVQGDRAAEHRRGRAHGAGRGLAVARSDRLRVPRARRVARGRGGADRPPARPLPPHRRAAHVAASARLGRRRAGGGHSPVARAVRDRPAAALVHPARRRAGVALPSAHTTVCAYKGTASHWSAAGEEAIAWSYEEPFGEVQAIQGLVAFYDERVDLEIDGEAQERPVHSGRGPDSLASQRVNGNSGAATHAGECSEPAPPR